MSLAALEDLSINVYWQRQIFIIIATIMMSQHNTVPNKHLDHRLYVINETLIPQWSE